MKEYISKKNTLILIIFLSLSLFLTSLISINYLCNLGVGGTYLNKILSKNFYYSDRFDEYLLPKLVDILEKSVDINISKEEKNKIRKKINLFKNFNFFVINNYSGEYFSNTQYKNEEYFRKDIKSYVDIEIINNGRTYIKNIEKSKVELHEDNNKLFNLKDDNICIYAKFPKDLIESDIIYENYYKFNVYSDLQKKFLLIGILSVFIFLLSTIFHIKNTKKYNEVSKYKNIRIPIELNILVIISMAILLEKNLKFINFKFQIIRFISIFLLSISIYYLFIKLYHKNKKEVLLEKSIILKQIYVIIEAYKDIFLIKKVILLGLFCILLILIGRYIDFKMKVNIFTIIISIISIILFTFFIMIKLAYLNYIIKGIDKIKNNKNNYRLYIKENNYFTSLSKNINYLADNLENVKKDSIKKYKKFENIKKKFINTECIKLKKSVDLGEYESKEISLTIDNIIKLNNSTYDEIKLNKLKLKEIVHKNINIINDKFLVKNLELVEKFPNEEIYILGNENQINIVLNKVLNNIYEYALEKTRVYIDINIDNENLIGCVSIKNISKEPIDINYINITEDKKDILDLNQNKGDIRLIDLMYIMSINSGEFDFKVDGDLFKILIKLKLSN